MAVKVDVYADIACAWSCLAVHRFHQVADGSRDVELVHLPFQLDPGGSDEPRPLMDVMGEMFGPDQARAMTTEMTKLGAADGFEYRFERALSVNTLAAHRLLWLVLRTHGAAVQAALAQMLFQAHFRDGINVADAGALAGLGAKLGLDGGEIKSFLASNAGDAETREQIAAASLNGITSVPVFVFDGGTRVKGEVSKAALADALRSAPS